MSSNLSNLGGESAPVSGSASGSVSGVETPTLSAFIGPELPVLDLEDMEDIEANFDEVVSLTDVDALLQDEILVDTEPMLLNSTIPGTYMAQDMKTSIMLAQADVQSLSIYVASAPESDPSLQNKRIRLSKRINDVLMLKKAAKALQDDGVEGGVVPVANMKQKSHVVPRNLPIFCWEGHDNIPGVHVFEDINTCIRNFVDVMNCHGLDLDNNFLRVIPACLSGTTRTWFEEYLSTHRKMKQGEPTWAHFAVSIQERYGLNAQEERNNCARELNAIVMVRNESLENFIDRFNSLRRRAVDQVLPDSLLAERFLCALPDALSNQVSIAAATLPEYKQFNVDILAGLARKLSNRFSKDKKSATFSEAAPRAPKRPSPFVNQDDEHHRSSRFSRHVGSEAGSSSSAAPVINRPLLTIRPQRAKSDKFCSVHRVTTHNTADCRAANTQGTGQSRSVGAAGSVSNVKKCFTCGVSGWTKEHVCNTARRNNDEYTFGAMSMRPTRVHNSNYIADAIATTEQAITRGNSSFSDDMDITGDAAYDIARQAQQ